MISINHQITIECTRDEIFRHFDSIEKLAYLKKEIGAYSVARSEPGLQIIDSVVKFPMFIKTRARLKYTTVPDRSAELKCMKGGIKKYSCAYSLSDHGNATGVVVRLDLAFAFMSPGFLLSFLIAPLMRRRIKREFKLIERLMVTE